MAEKGTRQSATEWLTAWKSWADSWGVDPEEDQIRAMMEEAMKGQDLLDAQREMNRARALRRIMDLGDRLRKSVERVAERAR
jgi:hypothetical protein